ncbi:PR domain zinc finger protein 13-like [Colletes latitarsis]|uniref:PR domain zinc finger protein 13-like n=1 Tax=Colletes latitarsis TaxID=2605962 RepID=UPI00403572AB
MLTRIFYPPHYWPPHPPPPPHTPPEVMRPTYAPQPEPAPAPWTNRFHGESGRNPRGEATYKCPDCGRFYMRHSCLTFHLRTECGKPPMFQCKICLGYFTYKHNLVSHMRIHTGSTQYKCDLCQKKFFRQDKLVEHKKKLHNVFP